MKIKKRFFVPFLLLFVVVIGVVSGFFWFKGNSNPVSSDTKKVDFVVPKGRSASQIASSLFDEGLIKSPLAFKFYVQLNGKSESIQAGEFKLSPSMNIEAIVNELLKGPVELWVTIPEGLRREEIVERYIKSLEMPEVQAQNFRTEFMLVSESKEGFLFPDTYLFPRDVKAANIVSVMRNTFDKKLGSDMGKVISEGDYSLEDLVIMASIIERETKKDGERPVVAGILFNRLKIEMGLQADATVQYAIASEKCQPKADRPLDENCSNWWPVLTRDDLRVNSPYNTYKYQGLPPSPIANPGLSSLKAAISPEENDYLYYLHDAEEKIHYAESLDEHNENVRKYLGK
ncbi:MAG: Aminodeoxychorismate lyase [Candidatus Woesebacteria bacterium GW2011_GWB1_38_8]|uniref:Endolytic murein transglycosylase n=1 Tax=Candidatus Woesebacteria bacterium GW2011_GWB1_38_8 TaxID=1618570 RepID=A0A0G0L4S5_9BACT|nr:MAG: Aminodeoxychorismate lyase [Candidatus Woesebacteria bacterium GW2011_GWB1_38_8]